MRDIVRFSSALPLRSSRLSIAFGIFTIQSGGRGGGGAGVGGGGWWRSMAHGISGFLHYSFVAQNITPDKVSHKS